MSEKKGILSDAGTAFLSILSALIVKGTLDAIFGHASEHYAVVSDILNFIGKHWFDEILRVSFHLVVFLLTVVRFYMGNLRHHQQVKETGNFLDFVIALATTVFLFSLFYVAGLLIEKGNLFYGAMFVTQVASLICSVVAVSRVREALRSVWWSFTAFDVANAVALFVSLLIWEKHPYLAPGLSLGTLAVTGALDVFYFWPFYVDDDQDGGWQKKIRWPQRICSWVAKQCDQQGEQQRDRLEEVLTNAFSGKTVKVTKRRKRICFTVRDTDQQRTFLLQHSGEWKGTDLAALNDTELPALIKILRVPAAPEPTPASPAPPTNP